MVTFRVDQRRQLEEKMISQKSIHRVGLALLLLALMVALPTPAIAQTPSGLSWNSAIAYANPYDQPSQLSIQYLSPLGDNFSTAANPINPYMSGELWIGSLEGADPSFQGAAVVNSSLPLSAVYLQSATGSVRSPVLYSGFTADQAADRVAIPLFTLSASLNSQLGIQNTQAVDLLLTLRFLPVGKLAEATYSGVSLPAGSSLVVDRTWLATNLPDSGTAFPYLTRFDGAVVVEASAPSAPELTHLVVASVIDIQTTSRRGYAYEGVPATIPQEYVYLPAAMCRYGSTRLTTTFSIQNASSGVEAVNGTVFIDYYSASGARITTVKASSGLVPGRRVNASACASIRMNRKSATARVYATSNGKANGPKVPLAVIAKTSSSDGLLAAFTGSTGGGTSVSIPYVPWQTGDANKKYRTYISIMNVGEAKAGNITIQYYKSDGTPGRTHVLATAARPLNRFAKVSSTAATTTSMFKGSAVVTSDQPVVVLVRVQQATTISGYRTLGEDYLGIPFAPLP